MQDFAQTTVSPTTTTAAKRSFLATIKGVFSKIGSRISLLRTKIRSLFAVKKIGTLFLILIVAGAVFISLRTVLRRAASTPQVAGQISTVPVSATQINRDFSFVVYDKNKKLTDSVKYTITDAQLTKEIIIKGQKASAVSGRAFLIINLKLVNDFNDSLFLNTRNYMRIQPKGSADKLAPEIHNDTVEVQPLSTKLTRIGLPVDENTKEFTLFVGELDGEKEAIAIKF